MKSNPNKQAPVSISNTRALLCCSMNGFAVHPALTSMLPMSLHRMSRSWNGLLFKKTNPLNQMNLILIFFVCVCMYVCVSVCVFVYVSRSVFPLLLCVAFVSSLFQIDTNKSITQKRLKKVSETVTVLSF